MPLDPVGGSAPGPCQGLCPWTPLGALPPNSSQWSLRVAAKAASFNSLAHWASASLFPPLAALGSRSSQRSLCVAAKAASFNSLAHWASASLFPPLAALGSRSSQWSLRVAAKAASFNSLAHWASASLFPPLAALGSAPLPLLKKAGENQLENFFGFPAEFAGPPLMGSGGLVLFVESRGRKGVADDSFGRQKTATARGGGGVWRPGGPRAPGPAKQKSRGRRQSLAPAFQGASRPAAAPGPLELPPTPKGSKKGGGQTAPLPIRCL